MNAIDINRLQVLNDLIAQTIDIMNQRGLAMAGLAPQLTPGLSHTPYSQFATPYGVPAVAPQFGPQFAQPVVPQVGVPYQSIPGLSHTPWNPVAPQIGFTHLATPYGVVPQVVPQAWNGLSHTPYIDPRFAPALPAPFAGGLSHTPYIDPRIDPRWRTVPMMNPFIR